MKKLSMVSLVILSFISFLISWSFVESSLSRNAQLKILNSSSASYTCTYYGNSSFSDDFYYMNKSLALRHSGEKIIAEILMYKVDKSYTINPFSSHALIKNDEMIVSKNIADKYNLKIGDIVTVSSSIYDNPFEYRVKEITAPAFCFTEEYFVEDKGIVILGNSSVLIEPNNLSLAFVSVEENLNGISLGKITSLATYKETLAQEIFVDFVIVVGVSCLMFVTYFVLFEVAFSFRIRKAIINGADQKSILSRYYSNPIVWSIIYSLLMALFVFIESWLLFSMLFVSIELMMMLIVPIIACILSLMRLKIKLRRV